MTGVCSPKMVLFKVLISFTFIWITHANDFAPRERCVPTAAAYGECHVCVCSIDGVYHCRAHACKDANATVTKEFKKECEPHRVYREDATFCSCSEDGLWVSNNCREKFRTLKSNTVLPVHKLKTNIECTPNNLYLLDCNICECGQDGHIILSSCTNRKCSRGHKVDVCGYGDYLRTYNELCSCSDINLYIDRLCLKVEDTAIQAINKSELGAIIDIGKTWTRTSDLYLVACVPGTEIKFDCNRCFCTRGKMWGCTMKKCVAPKPIILRTKKEENAFYSLPVLENPKELCKPGQHYRYKCNSCICTKKKVPMCTNILCLDDVVLDKRVIEKAYNHGPNQIRSSMHDDLPILQEGADCIPGKIYRNDCNTCQCGPKNSLMCTKMACLSDKDIEKVKATVKKQKKVEKMKKEKKIQEKKMQKEAKGKTYTKHWLPELPQGECVPGKLYQKDCRGCYCTFNKTAICVKAKNACDKNYYPGSADAIRPVYSQAEFNTLPKLPNIAAKCEPGKSYKVDCNSCVCLINHSLMCDMAMCLSYSDMHHSMAVRASNKNCTKGIEVEPPGECVQCSCSKNGKTKCEQIKGCSPTFQRRSLHGETVQKPRLKLEWKDNEKCLAGSIYKLMCNRCYCQEDGSMRCTQKTCLHYAQTLQLKKHRLYLKRHGL